MASDGFKFWDTYYSALKLLDDPVRRDRLVMALCAYVFDGVDADLSDDPMAEALYQIMHQQARTSKEISNSASERGKKGGRPAKSRAKSRAKSSAKSSAFQGVKSDMNRGEAKRADATIAGAAASASGAPASGPGALAPGADEPYEMDPAESERILAEVDERLAAWEAAGRPDDWPVGGEV